MSAVPPSLEERVERLERLERMVAEIHPRLGASPAEPGRPAALAPDPPTPTSARGGPRAEVWALRSEQWLGRVGLGLLFLGLVYLFNYSIEQGYLSGVRMSQRRSARGGEVGYPVSGSRKVVLLFPLPWECTKVVAPQERRPRWGSRRSCGLAMMSEGWKGFVEAASLSFRPLPCSLAFCTVT